MVGQIGRVVICCLWGVSLLLVGCGGGGGGSSTSEAPPVESPLSSRYVYELQGLDPGNGSSPGLQVVMMFPLEAEPFEVTGRLHPHPERGGLFSGTMDPDTGELTIAEGSGCAVYDLDLLNDSRDLIIRVENELVQPTRAWVSAGSIRVEAGDGVPLAEIGFGQPGGQVRLDYAWDDGRFTLFEMFEYDDFTGLWDAGAAEYEQLARFAFRTLMFLETQVNLVQYTLYWIGDHEDALLIGPYHDSGDSLDGLSGPDTIMEGPNDFTVTWFDDNGNGELGAGDGFDLECRQVYLDNSGAADYVFDGEVEFLGFVDSVIDDLVTERIGFEPFGDDPGGVFLNAFREQVVRVEENTLTPDMTYRLSGAFAIAIYPETL